MLWLASLMCFWIIQVEPVIDKIIEKARTGEIGDGKIFCKCSWWPFLVSSHAVGFCLLACSRFCPFWICKFSLLEPNSSTKLIATIIRPVATTYMPFRRSACFSPDEDLLTLGLTYCFFLPVIPVSDVVRIRTGERGEHAERMTGGLSDRLSPVITIS
jgi:hypothetical protein